MESRGRCRTGVRCPPGADRTRVPRSVSRASSMGANVERMRWWASRRGRGLLLLSCAVLGVALAQPPEQAAAAGKRCGEIARIGEAGVELVSVRARGVRCRSARAVLADQAAATSNGWECNSAGSEAVCAKGDATASYGPARSARSCGSIGFEANSDNVASSITAVRASCRTARAVARGSRDYGPTHARRYRARRFRCRARALDSALPSVLYTCRRGKATVAFQRS